MKRTVVQFLAGVSLVLAARGAVGSREAARPDHLYLVFCPLQTEQSIRAAQVERLAGLLDPRLLVIAVPCGLGATRLEPEAVRAAGSLSCPVAAEDGAWPLPAEVEQLRAGTDDWTVLVRAEGAPRVVRTEEAARLLAPSGEAAATDIDDSTWGKIKEIFR
ncbi:MAG: hypothetical protein WDA75_14905 [Candidatus Latescibacterota bacterium]